MLDPVSLFKFFFLHFITVYSSSHGDVSALLEDDASSSGSVLTLLLSLLHEQKKPQTDNGSFQLETEINLFSMAVEGSSEVYSTYLSAGMRCVVMPLDLMEPQLQCPPF